MPNGKNGEAGSNFAKYQRNYKKIGPILYFLYQNGEILSNLVTLVTEWNAQLSKSIFFLEQQ